MTEQAQERKARDDLRPHPSPIDVGLLDDGALIESVMRKSLAAAEALQLLVRAHKRMHTALRTVALAENLEAAVAKNALEDVEAILKPPVVYEFTYDHAGPDY